MITNHITQAPANHPPSAIRFEAAVQRGPRCPRVLIRIRPNRSEAAKNQHQHQVQQCTRAIVPRAPRRDIEGFFLCVCVRGVCPVGCCSAARTTHVASASPPPSGRAPAGSRDALVPSRDNGSLRCPFCVSAITTHWHAVGAAGEPARGGGGLLSARQLSGGGASAGHFCARATEARRPQGARSTWGGAKKEQVRGHRRPEERRATRAQRATPRAHPRRPPAGDGPYASAS